MSRYNEGEYTPVKKEIPDEEYIQALYYIRSERRLMEREKEIIDGSPAPPDGLPRGNGGTSDPTSSKAVKLDQIKRRLEIIRSCIEIVPPEYQKAVKGWINHKGRSATWAIRHYNAPCAESTLSRWRVAYVQEVARKSGISI